MLHTVLGRTEAERLVEEIRRNGNNAIAVGADLFSPQAPQKLFDEIEQSAGVTDIRDAVIFLCSQQARWITGQILQVAGGHAL